MKRVSNAQPRSPLGSDGETNPQWSTAVKQNKLRATVPRNLCRDNLQVDAAERSSGPRSASRAGGVPEFSGAGPHQPPALASCRPSPAQTLVRCVHTPRTEGQPPGSVRRASSGEHPLG